MPFCDCTGWFTTPARATTQPIIDIEKKTLASIHSSDLRRVSLLSGLQVSCSNSIPTNSSFSSCHRNNLSRRHHSNSSIPTTNIAQKQRPGVGSLVICSMMQQVTSGIWGRRKSERQQVTCAALVAFDICSSTLCCVACNSCTDSRDLVAYCPDIQRAASCSMSWECLGAKCILSSEYEGQARILTLFCKRLACPCQCSPASTTASLLCQQG